MPNLSKTFVVRQPGLRARPVDVTHDVYQRIDSQFHGFKDHELIALHTFENDWPTWEIHPHGDEIVVLLSGSARLCLDLQDGVEEHVLQSAGDFVIVPTNTWHTARINDPTSMLFITPGEGTRNEERP